MVLHYEEKDYSNIINGKIHREFLFEDEQCVVFNESNPQAPIHFLVVPKQQVSPLSKCTDDNKVYGHLVSVARTVAMAQGLDKSGYHVMVDESHSERNPRLISLHVFSRALHHMLWPVGPGYRL